MKRGGPIQRRSWIAGGQPPQRATPLTRVTPLTSRPATPRRPKHRPQWAAVRKVLWGRCGGRCERCGVVMHPATWQGHHRKLRSRGGQDTVPNAVALCANDHVLASWAVHRNPAVATRDGWIVPAHIDPADVPITLHDGRTVWLTDDGAYSTDRPDHEETRAA